MHLKHHSYGEGGVWGGEGSAGRGCRGVTHRLAGAASEAVAADARLRPPVARRRHHPMMAPHAERKRKPTERRRGAGTPAERMVNGKSRSVARGRSVANKVPTPNALLPGCGAGTAGRASGHARPPAPSSRHSTARQHTHTARSITYPCEESEFNSSS